MNRIIKKTICCLLAGAMCLSLSITAFAKPDWPSNTGILAEGGIIMDKDSGAVLFGQNIHLPYAPASITKLLTALVVVENSKLDEMVTFSDTAMNSVDPDSGNKQSLVTGDQLTVEDCLYLLLLQSSNQTANALAEHVAGSIEGFVQMMNDRMAQFGCTESHFANPSGLTDENQYVSAYDMALIAREAFSNESLLTIDSAKSWKIGPTTNNPDGVTIRMEHRLINAEDPQSQYYCEGVIAGKTGYTLAAGNTLVTLAQRGDTSLISVILKGTQPQYYLDSKELLEFGFANFTNWNISQNETDYVTGDGVTIGEEMYPASDLSLDEQAVITLPNGASFDDADQTLVTDLAQDHPDGALALVEYSYNERKVGDAWLYSDTLLAKDTAVQETQSETTTEAPTVEEKPVERGNLPDVLPIALGVLVVIAAAGGVAAFVLHVKHERERERLARIQRRERRIQRLKESGISMEEFESVRDRIAGEDRKRDKGDTTDDSEND